MPAAASPVEANMVMPAGTTCAYDLIGKIRQQPQGGAVAQAPVHSQAPGTEHLEAPGIGVHSRQAGYDEFLPQFQQGAVIIQPIRVRFILDAVPVEFRPVKSLDGIGVGYRSLRFRLGEAREPGELPPPALRYRFPQFVAKIAEKQERGRGGEFLAHEQHWYVRGEQVDGGRGTDGRRSANLRDALAERAVAHLVVTLQERYEGRGGR